MLAAILIAQDGATGPLAGLVDRLVATDVEVTIVDDLHTAMEHARQAPTPPVLLLDLREVDGGELEDIKLAAEAVKKLVALIPEVQPVVLTEHAAVALVLACVRAGAGDVIDLAHEGTATARAIVQRLHAQQESHAVDRETTRSLRSMVEDLVKDLVRTERRSIDLEEKLGRRASTAPITELRPPSVLLVEHERAVADELADRLEAAGVATYAYATGEEALREVGALAESTGLDLALIAAQLPGIDGLQTIRDLRERVPGLPAFLVTSVHDAELAEQAADLGVVGFVHKPIVDIEEIVERLAQLANESLQRSREHAYIHRIKERHERVLAKYRSLPREA
jgi:DNA-binding NtrC family response regulator